MDKRNILIALLVLAIVVLGIYLLQPEQSNNEVINNATTQEDSQMEQLNQLDESSDATSGVVEDDAQEPEPTPTASPTPDMQGPDDIQGNPTPTPTAKPTGPGNIQVNPTSTPTPTPTYQGPGNIKY
jgi:hypothetical protein